MGTNKFTRINVHTGKSINLNFYSEITMEMASSANLLQIPLQANTETRICISHRLQCHMCGISALVSSHFSLPLIIIIILSALQPGCQL